MYITGTERSDNGAQFIVLENDVGDQFLVPLADIMPIFRTLYGTRHTVLEKKRYYGREVYRPKA